MSNQGFPLNQLNPGWIKGWGVLRSAPWDLAGMFPTKEEAEIELAKRGPMYQMGYGSRRLGSNDFIFD